LAKPRNAAVAADLHNYYRTTQRASGGNTHSNACYSPAGNSRPLAEGEAGKEILVPFPAEAMKIRAVSRRVNKPEDNDPRLLEEGEMEEVGRLI
jgi:hypothetical protein